MHNLQKVTLMQNLKKKHSNNRVILNPDLIHPKKQHITLTEREKYNCISKNRLNL